MSPTAQRILPKETKRRNRLGRLGLLITENAKQVFTTTPTDKKQSASKQKPPIATFVNSHLSKATR